jgi:TetR/AcrR family transcriptional regulator, repressor of fatR-cypB operon
MTAQSQLLLSGHMQDQSGEIRGFGGREALSRREREKRVRQQEILKAARELFVSKGFRETTLDEIARHAEFGKGTLYNYFESKEDLFSGIIEQAIDEMSAIARESIAVPGGVREKLIVYARRLIAYVRENGELLHVIYHELHRSEDPANVTKLRQMIGRAQGAWDILAEPLKKEIESHTLRDCDPRQLVVLFDGMLRGFCFDRFTVDRTSTVDDAAAAEFITSVFLEGIVKRKGKG